MTPNPEPLDYDTAKQALSNIARQIRDAERFHREQIEKAAQAESDYRRALSMAFVAHKAGGCGAGEAELRAKGDCAELSRERDVAAGMVRAALESLENRRGDRASLHRLCEWSMKVNPEGSQHERVAA